MLPRAARLVAMLSLFTGVAFGAALAPAQELAAECEYAPNGPSHLLVGSVECVRLRSTTMGDGIPVPFSYYIPPAFDPALARRCPVLYLLHGLTGGYQAMIGARGQAANEFVRALTSGPPVDPRTVAEPWLYHTTDTWVAKPPLDFILVAPHGVTQVDGYNPTPGQAKDCGWQDYNPDYWEGGRQPFYGGPPPRCASMFTEEVIPYVERHFPVIADRSGRALSGISYGSVGTGHIGLRRPDLFSSLQMISGVGLAWPPACVVDPGGAEVASPLEFPIYLRARDPAADRERREPAAHLHLAERRRARHRLLLHAAAPPARPDGQRARVPRRRAGAALRVQRERFGAAPDRGALGSVHRGRHRPRAPRRHRDRPARRSGGHAARGAPHLRVSPGPPQQPLLGAVLPRMDGGDVRGRVALGRRRSRLPAPDVFDYRTAFADFEVWGWQFSIDRPIREFVNLTDVSCDSVTLRGTGRVTLTVPAACGSGVNGGRTVMVDLGPSPPLDEPAALGLCASYGNTETVALSDLDGDGLVGFADNCPAIANADQLDRGGVTRRQRMGSAMPVSVATCRAAAS